MNMGIRTIGKAVRNHISSKTARELIDCNISNLVPFVVLGISAIPSSTTPSSTSSSSQASVFDVNRYTENPVQERCGSSSEELRRDPLHRPTETENKSNNEGREEVQSDLLHHLPDWLQEFRENFVDDGTSEERQGNTMQKSADTSSSSHDRSMEPRKYVEQAGFG